MNGPGSDAPTIQIRGNIILDERREVGDLWVRGGRISLTRPSAQGSGMRTLEGWVLPGLVDVHCHIGLGAQGAVTQAVAERQAISDRDSGVLLVRDAGSPSDTTWVSSRGDLPRVVRSGRHLALRKRYLRNFAHELDDPAELPAAVRQEAGSGDGWVKLVGDWIDRAAGDLSPLWPDDVLARAVTEAHEEAARVTVHTFGTETIDGLLAAGVDCIEHGTGMTHAQMDAAAAAGIPVTPTLLQVAQFESIADQAREKFPAFAARMRAMHARRHVHVRELYDAGVRLLVGTDAGGTIAHGRIADECAELVAAGIPAAEVVAAVSWRARSFLGLGAVVEGASADLVVYPDDPRENIDVLRYPTAVILRGEIY